MRNRAWFALACFMLIQPAFAQPQLQPPAATNAPKLVREANELLLGDKPAEALRTYEQAQSLRPDAREIAFDQALAHYRLGEFDKAREAFTRAAGGVADALADDAQYGMGTCDHAEALTAKEPKEAVGRIENAMRSYQSVLGNQREHATARDANLKAASYWRQLKQQLQQQQQQNQDQQNQEQNDEQKQDQQQQSQQDKQQSDQKKQEQQKESQAQQDQQKEQQKQQAKEQEASAKKEENKEQKQSAEEKEEASHEQAERKLREMMQAMRDRKKLRREETKTPTYRPTEKDW
jgi:flagellar biosynthesis GTPase FlhF